MNSTTTAPVLFRFKTVAPLAVSECYALTGRRTRSAAFTKLTTGITILLLHLILCAGFGQDRRSLKIDALLSDLHQKHLFNGAMVIGQHGTVFFSKGYGFANLSDAVLFTPTTASDGGSNAKTVTAAAILLLAEEGKLKLADPVQRYLPEYPYPKTTVGNLITHSTGGLPDYDYFFENAADTALVTTALNLKVLAKNKPALRYPPGQNFYYDNAAFDLAALLVEQVSGRFYGDFISERIFHPVQMNASFIRPGRLSDWSGKRTVGYRMQNDSLELLDIADREGFYGGCNIWFTATDLYRWATSFYHQPIFSDKLIKEIIAPVFFGDKLSRVRQGAWYRGKTKSAFYYWGNVAGFYSWVYWDREREFTIAFMTNTGMPQWARPLMTSALIDIVSEKGSTTVREPVASVLNPKRLSQITGIYNIRGIGRVQIALRDSKPTLRVNNGMEYAMHLVDKKTFYVPGYDPWISFASLRKGKFKKVNWASTAVQTVGQRVSK